MATATQEIRTLHIATTIPQPPHNTDNDEGARSTLLHVRLLGDFLISKGDTLITGIDLPRMRSLFTYLVLHSNAPQDRAHLAFLLWPDSTDSQALGNLRTLVHRLRNALPEADTLLRVERQELHWQPSIPWKLDVIDFERAIAQAEQCASTNAKELRRVLEQAVALYRGDLLPTCYDEWISAERDRLRELFLTSLKRLLDLLEQERDYPGAISAAQRLLRHDPLHEETYRRLMRLYAVTGDRSSALRTYHTCVTVLERELASEPEKATRQLYERLMRMKETAGAKSSAARRTGTQLVGRQHEWAHIQVAWKKVSAGSSQLLLLVGEAGIGKTRLAEELLRWAERQGIGSAVARCYAAEGKLTYGPIAAWLKAESIQDSLLKLSDVWLTELARFVPDLLTQRPDLPRPTALTESWQRQHLFEALAHAVVHAHQPLILFLDDLQWCDTETLHWLHYLLRFSRRARLLIIGTMRPDEILSGHPLVPLLTTLRREEQVTEVDLAPLSAAETTALAEQVAGRSLNPTLTTALYQETEGSPLFIVETMRAGLDEASNAQQWSLPVSMQAAITSRLAQLSPTAQSVMNVAAVIGRASTFDVLVQASKLDEEETVLGLDELWQRRILREQGSDGYDFSHGKLREAAYAQLSIARRRLLHRRVAEAIEAIHVQTLEAVSGQLATHYEQAGLFQQAIIYYQRAADTARQVYVHTEALMLLQRALSLLETSSFATYPQWCSVRALLLERRGDIFMLTTQYDEARNAYQCALPYIAHHEHIALAHLYQKIAKTWEAERKYEDALRAYREAESRLGHRPTEATQAWWQEWIAIQDGRVEVHYWLAQVEEMAALIQETWPVVEQYGTAELCAAFFLSLAKINLRRECYQVSEETVSYARLALDAYQETGDLVKISWMHYHLSWYALLRNDLDEAEAQVHNALAITEKTGDLALQSQCHTFLSVVKRKQGRKEETLQSCSHALKLLETTQRPEERGVISANLAWIAWHEGKLAAVEEYALAALADWKKTALVYPFHWMALWPLIAATCAQGRIVESIGYAYALLVPDQQSLPDSLGNVVNEAISAREDGRLEDAHKHLQHALVIAQEMGYL